MKDNYDACEKLVLKSEGGYTNDPKDPGGPTNWGITIYDARMYWKNDATAEDVRVMPLSVAKEIYKSKYWDKMGCDALPAGLDYTVFDYGVNSGIARSEKIAKEFAGKSVEQQIEAINDERLSFLKSLPTWGHFGGGWSKRVASVKDISLHMAQSPTPHVADATIPTGKGVILSFFEEVLKDTIAEMKNTKPVGA